MQVMRQLKAKFLIMWFIQRAEGVWKIFLSDSRVRAKMVEHHGGVNCLMDGEQCGQCCCLEEAEKNPKNQDETMQKGA